MRRKSGTAGRRGHLHAIGGLQPYSGVFAPYLQARGYSVKGTQPYVYQRFRVFFAHGEEMPHQYRVGLHDCVETHRFHCEERRAFAVQPLCRIYQLSRKCGQGLPHPNGDTDAHGRTDEERHPRACTGLVRLFCFHGFGVFGREEPHRRPPANILRRQPVDNHPKKEDQHRIKHPPFGRSQAYHRKVQGAGKGRSCFPRSE